MWSGTGIPFLHPPLARAYFSVVLATLRHLGNLECALGNLEVWSTFSLSYACYIVANFENGTTWDVAQNNEKFNMDLWIVCRVWSQESSSMMSLNSVIA